VRRTVGDRREEEGGRKLERQGRMMAGEQWRRAWGGLEKVSAATKRRHQKIERTKRGRRG